MRLDKYLQLARLVKRRSAAQEMISIGAVRINKRQCKPASEVKTGDTVEIAYPMRILTVEVLCDDEAFLKRRDCESYKVKEEKRADPAEKPW